MFDVIIVPGRGIDVNGTLTIDSIARVEKAVELYKDNINEKIIMSGPYSVHLINKPINTEANAMKNLAISLGCKAKDIIEENKSSYTIENAFFTKKLICEVKKWYRIVIVASSDHIPRVKYLFQKVYGDKYNLEFIHSRRVIDDNSYKDQLKHEHESLRLSHKWLDSIKDGDDRAVKLLITSKRPNDPIARYNYL